MIPNPPSRLQCIWSFFSFLLALELFPLLASLPKLEGSFRDFAASSVGQKDENGAPEIDAPDGLVIVDKGLNCVEEPNWHLIDFIKNEERLGALAHVASDPILQLQLVLVELFIIREVHGGDEEVYVFAIEAFCVETFSNELGDVVLANAGLSVEAEYQSLRWLPLAHMRPEG